MGGTFVVLGVIFISFFCPSNPQPLTPDGLNQLIVGPGAIR